VFSHFDVMIITSQWSWDMDDVQQPAVALGLEGGVVLRAPGGDAGDELQRRERRAEPAEHLGVHPVVEVEDVARVGVEHGHELDAVMLGGGQLPADLGDETRPVRLAVLERQQHGGAQPGLGPVVDERLLRRPGPLRRGPRGGRGEVLGSVDERRHGEVAG